MDFQFGADVRRPDGGKLGQLRRLIMDPDTGQIASLVVTHNAFDGREVIVPLGVVNGADDEAIELAASEQQFDDFDDYMTERNVAPPPDAGNVTSDLIHDPVDVADSPPIGAATGIESIAFTPVLQETVHVPGGDEVLDGETVVWATDKELGQLRQIRTNDQTSRVMELIVERGFVFKHDTAIPFETVATVRSETIVLSVPSADLAAEVDD